MENEVAFNDSKDFGQKKVKIPRNLLNKIDERFSNQLAENFWKSEFVKKTQN